MAEGRQFKDTYTLEALLTGDASRLKKAIDRAKALLKTLDDDEEVEIDGNAKPLERSIRIAKTKIAALKKENATIDIKGDTKHLNKSVNESFDLVDMLQKKASVIEINAKGLDRLKELQTIKVKEVDFDGAKVNVSPDFNAKAAEAKVSKFKKLLQSIPNRIKTWASVDVDKSSFNIIRQLGRTTEEFQRNMSKMARSIESFAVVLGNQLKGGLLTMSTALVPLIAGLVPAVMALGNALGVLVGGLGGLVGAFGLSVAAGAGWGGMMATVLARYSDEAFQATKQSERFSKALDGLKATWNKTVDGNQAKIFDTMSNAIEGVTVALGKLRPMFDGVSKVMLSASKSFKDFLSNSPIAKRFFNMMNTSGVKIFDTLLSAIGKFGAGTMQVFNLLEPLMSSMASGFEDMAGRFMKWSQSVEAEKGFKKFTDYVNTNMPLIRRIFGDTFKGIINLFAAFGQNSNLIFQKLADMSTAFRTWSANLKQSDGFQKFIEYVQRNAPNMISLIGNVIMTLVNLGIALAPLGEKVLDITNKFFNFTKELLANHPVIGQIIGVLTTLLGAALVIVPVVIQLIALWHNLIQPMLGVVKAGQQGTGILSALSAAFSFLTGPIMAIIAVIGVLVASFIHLWNTNENFRANVISIWNQIKEHISNAITAVKDFVMQIWGQLSEWWAVNNQNIMNVVQVVWTGILNAIQMTMNTIVPIIQVAWELIKTIITVTLQLILGIVGTVMALLNGDWQAAWEQVKTTAINIWNAIKTMFVNIWNIIKEAFTTWLTALKTQAGETWNVIKQVAMTIWNAIKTWLLNLIQELVTNATNTFNQFKSVISTIFNAIKTFLSTIWNAIKTWIINIITTLVVNAVNKFLQFQQNISNTFNAIKTFLSNIWNAIKAFVVSRVQELVTNAVNRFNQFKSAVSNIFNAVKSFLSNVWNSIKSFVINTITNLVNTAVNWFNNLKSRATSIFNAVRSFMSSVWNSIKSTVSSIVRAIFNTVRSIFNSIRSTISSIMSAIRSVISSIWNAIRSVVSSVVNAIRSVVSAGFNAVRYVVSGVMSAVRSVVSSAWSAIRSVVSSAVNAIRSVISSGFNAARSVVSSSVNAIRSTVSSVFNALGSVVSSAMTRVRNAVANGMNAALRVISGIMGSFRTAGSNIVTSIANGIRGAIGKVTSAISSVTSAVRRYLPFSPAKEGALRDIMKTNIVGSIAQTIDKQRKLPLKAMEKVTKGVQSTIDRYNPTITPDLVGINRGIQSAQQRAQAVMNHTVKAEVNSQPIQANISLDFGKRNYETQVADITHSQNEEAKLNERYGV